jgi:hypothetical protein
MTRANSDIRRGCECDSCPCKQFRISNPFPEFFEHDSSPLATQTMRFFSELEEQRQFSGTNFWETYCELFPSAIECRIYEE